jgi:hypothetical protein
MGAARACRPAAWLVGGAYPVQPWKQPGALTRLPDRGSTGGSGSFACDLSPGAEYDYAGLALPLNGATYANATLGASAAAWLQRRFTAVTTVQPLAVAGNATVWELRGAAGQASLALRVESGRYVLRHSRGSGGGGDSALVVGPVAAAGARRALQVRCSAWRWLCTLS